LSIKIHPKSFWPKRSFVQSIPVRRLGVVVDEVTPAAHRQPDGPAQRKRKLRIAAVVLNKQKIIADLWLGEEGNFCSCKLFSGTNFTCT
jgi:hypothetical protein